jgi:hypothetical protein
LLRLAEPEMMPSVLILEPPASDARTIAERSSYAVAEK